MIRRAAVEITLSPVQSMLTASRLGRHLPPFGSSLSPPNVIFYGPFCALPLRYQILGQNAILPVGSDRIPPNVNFYGLFRIITLKGGFLTP